MARHISASDFGQAWKGLLAQLMEYGAESKPRGMATLEFLNVTFEVRDGLSNILVNPVRDLNYRFMIAEWLWITAGINGVDILAQYNSRMKEFSDDGAILSGAYGPRLMPQIPYILESLAKPDSRQAVATIWTPTPSDSKDIPCTVSLQWLLRGGLLHCTVNMRSSDIWLGLPYDYFTFSQITNMIARLIGKAVGSVTMNLASSHIYEQHWKLARQALSVISSTISSPHIPRNESIPDSAGLEKILNRGYPNIGPFWSRYSLALKDSKRHALEVLNGFPN